MALIGEKLTDPKLAAIILAVYAIGYGVLMLIAGAFVVSEPSIALIMLGLLAFLLSVTFVILAVQARTNANDIE